MIIKCHVSKTGVNVFVLKPPTEKVLVFDILGACRQVAGDFIDHVDDG
jgi:hypothetical protein